MTRIFDEKFEGAGYEESWSDGEIIDGSSVVDEDFATASVTGADPTWGSQCLRIAKGVGERAFVRHDLAAPETTLFVRVEVIFASFPTGLGQFSNMNFYQIQDSGSTTCFNFRIQERGASNNGPYQLQFGVNDDGTQQSNNSGDIALDTRYRLEAMYDIAGGAWAWRLDGADMDNGAIGVGAPTEVQNNLALGPQGTGGGAVEFFLDNVALDDADWIGAEINLVILRRRREMVSAR